MTRESEEKQRGRGRPKKEKPCDIQLKGWISQSEQEMMDHMLIESDKGKSELLRKMIQTYYYTYRGKW
jgi:hypothetical protein